jgi:tetratricopeptide (TPR) repeat protein
VAIGALSPPLRDQVLAAAVALSERAESDPKGVAAGLIETARGASDHRSKARLAMLAFDFDPQNSDALLLVAEALPAKSTEVMQVLDEALRIAEQNMGDRPFERHAGRFGEVPETLPWLRASALLAGALHRRGETAAAVVRCNALLELWPDEVFGIQELLAQLHLTVNALDDLEKLLRRYPDNASVNWRYAWALLAFRRGGRSVASQAHLAAAMAQNRFVVDYLLGKRTPPKTMPDDDRPGSLGEALHYVQDCRSVWIDTPGALDWLRDSLKSAGTPA